MQMFPFRGSQAPATVEAQLPFQAFLWMGKTINMDATASSLYS